MMKELTFENVKKNDFDLVYEIPKSVGETYEELTSFNRGRDFNKEVRDWIINFVSTFESDLTKENEAKMNNRLVEYNNLIVDLRTKILQATKIPSILISGGSNYPTSRKEKELARIHQLEGELYSADGKHARFLDNTRKMFDSDLIDQREQNDRKRKERSIKNGWRSFYKEINHAELTGYGIDLENNRVYITTNGKPSEKTRKLFKQAALRWSPKNKRWQRILTENAVNSILREVFTPLSLGIGEGNFIS